MRGTDPLATLATAKELRRAKGDPPLNPYAETLVAGVVGRLGEIDDQLSTYAIGWTLDRMPAVDRNVLRIGAYELLMDRTVPPGVAIAEAVLLVKELSTDESPRFVNGLLSRLKELAELDGIELTAPDAVEPDAGSVAGDSVVADSVVVSEVDAATVATGPAENEHADENAHAGENEGTATELAGGEETDPAVRPNGREERA